MIPVIQFLAVRGLNKLIVKFLFLLSLSLMLFLFLFLF